ncbi:uncharacterized protein C9orf40 homolog [Tiliqua scincoides]|uniref:uncharacterized protein C9orf40 homolog n=1 Tax=Tiliqua scincoides TaxID=71010 RepID=UPI003462F67F
MAKRGAEALAYRAPWESLLLPPPAPRAKRSRSDCERPRRAAVWAGGKKRKREEEEAAEAARGKRPAPSETSGLRKEAEAGAVPPQGPTPLVPEEAAASGGDLDENDVWNYNSFQYWRSPLPTIDLSDILDLEKDDTVEARDSSSIGLSEMET